MKKTLSILLSILVVFSMICFSFPAYSQEHSAFVVSENIVGHKGETVDVVVNMDSNIGITAFRFIVSYDDAILNLTNIEFVNTRDFNMAKSQSNTSPVSISGYNASKDVLYSGAIAVLTFEISDNCESGEYLISLSYDIDDVFNMNGDTIYFDIIEGSINVIDDHEHFFDVVIDDSTCQLEGEAIYTCRICGLIYNEIIGKKQHVYIPNVIEPSCESIGYTICSCECGDNYIDDFVEALGHNYHFNSFDSDNGLEYICPDCRMSFMFSVSQIESKWNQEYISILPQRNDESAFLDVVQDGIINGKDYAKIIHIKNYSY